MINSIFFKRYAVNTRLYLILYIIIYFFMCRRKEAYSHLYSSILCLGYGGTDGFISLCILFGRNHFFILLEGEATGRLLRYDPPTKTTHVVLDGLAFPNGVQLSRDQTFLLFTETTNCRYLILPSQSLLPPL